MSAKNDIERERTAQMMQCGAVNQMLEAFSQELDNMAEFSLMTHRYIIYAVAFDEVGNIRIYRYTFRTLKEVCGIADGTGGLYNHTFKWQEVENNSGRRIYWSIVLRNLKYPLVAVAALKLDVGLSELGAPQDGPTT